MLNSVNWRASKELATGYVMNNNFMGNQKEIKPPKTGVNADPAETVLTILREFFGERPRRVLMSALEDMDTDNSGQINFDEFARGLKGLNIDLPEKSMRQVFAKFDDTGNGVIDRCEVLLEMGSQEPDSAHSRWFRTGIGKLHVPANHEPPSRHTIAAAHPTGSSGYQHSVRMTAVYGSRPRPQTARARMQQVRPPPRSADEIRDETLAVLRNFFQCRTATAQWNCFQDMDSDNSGFISFEEFQSALHRLHLFLPVPHLKCVFESFDDSGDGTIDIQELKREITQDSHSAYGREIGPETSSLAASAAIEMCSLSYTANASATDAAASFKAMQKRRPQSASSRRC